MARWAAGGIIRSSVVTRYQQGLDRQVGWLTSPPRASTPHGTCESARNYARGMALSLDQALNLAVGQPIQRDRHRRNPVGRMTGKSPAAANTAAGLEPQTTAHTDCSFWRVAATM